MAAHRIVGVLLAGGRSRRMGKEKPLVEVGGRSLIERVADAVSPCVEELVVVTNKPKLYEFLGRKLIADTHVGRGPLAGIQAALKLVPCAAALVVACDYPFLEVQALERIVREDPEMGVVVPRIEGHLHPLCALYAVEVLPAVEECLARGVLMVHSLLDRAPLRILAQEELGGPAAARTFFNVNTPDDLRRAEALLAEAQSR